MECANGQTGFGKRRRRNVDDKKTTNKVYEVSMSTVVRVGDDVVSVDGKNVEKSTRREKETFVVEEGKMAFLFTWNQYYKDLICPFVYGT